MQSFPIGNATSFDWDTQWTFKFNPLVKCQCHISLQSLELEQLVTGKVDFRLRQLTPGSTPRCWSHVTAHLTSGSGISTISKFDLALK